MHREITIRVVYLVAVLGITCGWQGRTTGAPANEAEFASRQVNCRVRAAASRCLQLSGAAGVEDRSRPNRIPDVVHQGRGCHRPRREEEILNARQQQGGGFRTRTGAIEPTRRPDDGHPPRMGARARATQLYLAHSCDHLPARSDTRNPNRHQATTKGKIPPQRLSCSGVGKCSVTRMGTASRKSLVHSSIAASGLPSIG